MKTILPVKDSKMKEIRDWLKSNNISCEIDTTTRPNEYYNYGSYDDYSFYLFVFSSKEDLTLFNLIHPFDEREWMYFPKGVFEV